MREGRGPLILIAVLVVAAVVWFAVHRRSEINRPMRLEPVEAVRFEFEKVAVGSSDLRVGPARVRGAIQQGFTSWLVMMECAEAEGCIGEFAVTVSYHTGTERRQVVLVNRLEAPMGGELRFQGLQDPSTQVLRIDELTLDVRSSGAPSVLPYDVID